MSDYPDLDCYTPEDAYSLGLKDGATRLAAIVSFFEGEKDIDSAAPWALGEVRRIIAEHDSDRGTR